VPTADGGHQAEYSVRTLALHTDHTRFFGVRNIPTNIVEFSENSFYYNLTRHSLGGDTAHSIRWTTNICNGYAILYRPLDENEI
jgi:hypothetical protein